MVDENGDQPWMESYLGKPVTLESGWQADFNHQGVNVDGSDLAYWAGRLDSVCGVQKAATGSQVYHMKVENLESESVRAMLEKHGMTIAQVLQAWDSMGLSYDRDAASRILASDDSRQSGASWSHVKTLYK